jgi:ligand-binding sensor domain-containing protein
MKYGNRSSRHAAWTLLVMGVVALVSCSGGGQLPDGTTPPPASTPPLFTSFLLPWVKHLAIDSSAGKWIGTDTGGLYYFDDNGTPTNKDDDTWVTFTTSDGLPSNQVLCVEIDSGGAKWIGTYNGGVARLDDHGTPTDKADDTLTVFTKADGLVQNYVGIIAFDPSGGKWFGTTGNLSYLDDKGTPTNKADDTWVTYSKSVGGLLDQLVYDVVFETAGSAWIATLSGMNYLDFNGTPTFGGDDTWASFTTADGIVGMIVGTVKVDPTRGVWIGAGAGVNYLDDNDTPANKTDDTMISFTTSAGLAFSSTVYTIVFDSSGRKWIGCPFSSSISVLGDNSTPADKNDDTWTTYTTADGLDGGFIEDIVIDSNGAKWVGTSRGLDYCP